MDDPTDPNDQFDEPLAGLLTAFADALAPDRDALARVRARLVQASLVRSIDGRAAGHAARRGGLWIVRRPFAGLAAAGILVLVVVGGAFAASGPGAPLYGARIWLETVTLPADPGARAAAEIDRLDTRLGEAEAAARQGNGAAVTAAITAYRDELDAATTAAAGDASRTERLQAALEQHQVVLEALVGALAGNGNASEAIRSALDRNAETIDRIVSETPAGTPGGGQGGGNAGGPSANPGQGDGQGGGNPNATPPGQGGGNPNATPPGQGGNPHGSPPGQRAAKTPNPTPTPSPSTKPGRTPNPKGSRSPSP